jgi:uncharacterized membrane protein
MIEFTNMIFIERPLDEAFKFISNFENMSKWNYYVIDVEKLSDGPVRVGTKYHQTRKDDQQQFQIVAYQKDKTVAIETLPPERKLKMQFHFIRANGGVKIRDTWQIESSIPSVFNWIAEKRVKTAVSANLEKLKHLLETGEVTLQDGRIEKLSRSSRSI